MPQSDHHSLWNQNISWDEAIEFKENDVKEELKTVLRILHQNYPELYFGKSAILNDDAVKNLVLKVCPKRLNEDFRYCRLTYLIKGLSEGKKQGIWQLKIPPLPAVIRKEINRITPLLGPIIDESRGFSEVFTSNLKNIPTNKQQRIGQILISASLFGGLNDPFWLEPFCASLKSNIFLYKDILWVDLWSDKHRYHEPENRFLLQTNAKIYRRWVADPLTQLLLYRWLKDHSNDTYRASKAWDYINDYLDCLDLPKSQRPKTKSDFFKLCQAYSSYSFPPFLAAYAEGKLISSSLPDEIWLRLLTGKNAPVTQKLGRIKTNVKITINESVKNDVQTQKKYLKKIRQKLTSEFTPDKAKRHIEKVLIDDGELFAPMLTLISAWAIQLLSDREFKRERRITAPLAPSSVNEYLKIAKYLLAECEEKDPQTWDAYEIWELYKRIYFKVKKSSDGDPKEYLRNLDQFHGFLSRFYGIEDLDIRTLDKNPKRQARVNANLMSCSQFKILLKRLGIQRKDLDRHEKMIIVAAILGFRAGMRRNEICGLQLKDIQGANRYEVVVTKNNFRGLKSKAARRRIPLYLLLPNDELGFVRSWHEERLYDPDSKQRSPLFAEDYSDEKPVSDAYLFDTLRTQLKEVTKDQSFRFHNLRHSFLTWLLMKQLIRQDIPQQSKIDFLDDPDFAVENRRRLKDEILKNESSGRKTLYSGTILTGHLSIEQDFHSYMHLTDFLLGHYSRHKCNNHDLDIDSINALIGCQDKRAHQIKNLAGNILLTSLTRTSPELRERLAHPLLEKTTPVPLQKKEGKRDAFPDFSDALNLMQRQFLNGTSQHKFPADAGERERVRIWYDTLNGAGKSRRKYLRIAKKLTKSYWSRGGVITVKSVGVAQEILDFLNEICGLKNKSIPVYFKLASSPNRHSKSSKNWKQALNKFPIQWKQGSKGAKGNKSSIVFLTKELFPQSSIESKGKKYEKSLSFEYFLALIV